MADPGAAVAGVFGMFFLLWIFLFLLMIGAGIASMVFWIFMIVDCAKRDFKSDNDKVVWIILLAMTHVLGATIYYFVIKKKDKIQK